MTELDLHFLKDLWQLEHSGTREKNGDYSHNDGSIQVKDDGSLEQSNGGGSPKKWMNLGCIFASKAQRTWLLIESLTSTVIV